MRISDWSSDVCSSDHLFSRFRLLNRRLIGRRNDVTAPETACPFNDDPVDWRDDDFPVVGEIGRFGDPDRVAHAGGGTDDFLRATVRIMKNDEQIAGSEKKLWFDERCQSLEARFQRDDVKTG